MNTLEPINQTKLFGLNSYINELIGLYENKKLPNKILFSGQKGIGKSTLAYHLVNYILSKNEQFEYDINHQSINLENHSYKTVLNKSNPNFILIDINQDNKSININQIRELISNLNKSSFNTKPRFVLIDNIEFLNKNSINALLKILEEPSTNIYFILINSNKKILQTLLSRCINYRISISNKENYEISNKLLDGKLFELINNDLINYYFSPGNIYNLYEFGKINEYDLMNLNLKEFLKIIIKDNHYKKNNFIKYLIFDLIEFYFTEINFTFTSKVNDKYNYFIKKISDSKRFNLDVDILFMEFEDEILNG